MKRIPFTQAVILSGAEVPETADYVVACQEALDQAAAANASLLKDWMAAQAKVKEYANLIVVQSEAAQQIMQINLLISGALGRVREGEDVEEVIVSLEAQLAEFGGDPGGADSA